MLDQASGDILKNRLKQIVEYGETTLSSGKKSSYYVNIKNLYGKESDFRPIVKKMYGLLMNDSLTHVAASGLGGIPLSTSMTLDYSIPQIGVRIKKTECQTEEAIEYSKVGKESRVGVLDDVLTSGGSLKKTIQKIKEREGNVVCCYVVVDRSEDHIDSIDGIPVKSLFKIDDILDKNRI